MSGCRLADKQVLKVLKDAETIGISVFGTAVREMPAFGALADDLSFADEPTFPQIERLR